MKKFYYSLFVLVFGFAMVAGAANLTHSLVAFAQEKPIDEIVLEENTDVLEEEVTQEAISILEICEYAAPTPGYHWAPGPDYNPETFCGMILVPDEQEPDTAIISATKIVCDSESDLPNWGAGGPDITSTTASDFLSNHPNCHEVGWVFEWAPDNTPNPGDNLDTGGTGWTTFSGTTNVPSGARILVREQVNYNYIPFTGYTTTEDVSAEIYCHTDVLNYDNFDWIDPVVAGENYNCVGFNVKKVQENEYCPIDGELSIYEFFDAVNLGLIDYSLSASYDTHTATAVVNNRTGCTIPMSLVAYKMYDRILSHQELYDKDGLTIVGATHTFVVDFPRCMTQIDLWYGDGPATLLDSNPYGGYNVPRALTWTMPYNLNNGYLNAAGQFCEQIIQQCEVEQVIVSDSTTLSDGNSTTELTFIHDTWTAVIPGAIWIWSEEPLSDPVNETTVTFTKNFMITGEPTGATLEIAADNSYEVFVNGNLVGSDPDLHNFTLTGQDAYVIPVNFLVTGSNTITFVVTNQYFPNGTQELNPAGLMYKLTVNENNCGDENLPPVADAGADQNLTLPTDSTTLDGSASTDPDGTIVSYVWTFVSGPTNVDPDDLVNPSISGLVEGTYVFQLTVTDNDGATDTDIVSIIVSSGGGGGGGGGSRRSSSGSRLPIGEVLGEQVCNLDINTYMRKGYRNNTEEVKIAQDILNRFAGANLVIDGIFGPQTETAVRIFQLKYASEVIDPWPGLNGQSTGIIYKTTLVKMKNLLCGDPELPIPTDLIDWSQNPSETPPPLFGQAGSYVLGAMIGPVFIPSSR